MALNWSANHVVRLLGVEPKDEVTSTFTLDEQAAKTRYWNAFKPIGEWWGALPPY